MSVAARIEEHTVDSPEIFVGKDVLELLSSSMYVNPLSIFREYVQNATDAIDDAVALGLLASNDDGLIEINLDHIDRRVIIRDNGKGLSNTEFPTRMVSFGASEKRDTDARGLRGVGRLSGLGYVQRLVFRSRATNDSSVLEAAWDGRVVKSMLASTDRDIDLETIVRDSVTVKRIDPEGYPAHFFEVELNKPRRIANDKLLNESEIEFFLAQVCPCPFSPDFSYGRETVKLLAPYGRAGKSYAIHVNGSDTPIYRPYRDEVAYSDTKTSSLGKFKSFEIESIDGECSCGRLAYSSRLSGERFPSHKVFVACAHELVTSRSEMIACSPRYFPEERFCSWTIGEVHVLDARVVPNGRRDEFEASTHLDNIIAHLRPLGAEIARECRISSRRRNRMKSFELGADKIYEKLDVIQQGAVSEEYAKSIKAEIGSVLAEMRKAVDFELFEDDERRAFRSRLTLIKKAVDACTTKVEGNVLDGLSHPARATYKRSLRLDLRVLCESKLPRRTSSTECLIASHDHDALRLMTLVSSEELIPNLSEARTGFREPLNEPSYIATWCDMRQLRSQPTCGGPRFRCSGLTVW